MCPGVCGWVLDGCGVWMVCVGILTKPGIAEKTCVMRSEARSAGFSASARSERYNRGIISVALTDGGCPLPGWWCGWPVGLLGW